MTVATRVVVAEGGLPMRPSRIAATTLAVVALAGFAGCGGDDDGGEQAADAFCDLAEQAGEEGVFAALGEADPTQEEGRQAYQEALDYFERLEAEAPSEIRDDLATMKRPIEVLAEGDVDQLSELAADEEFTAEVNAANNNVNSYLVEECGLGGDVEPNDTTSQPTGSAPTSTTSTPATTGTDTETPTESTPAPTDPLSP